MIAQWITRVVKLSLLIFFVSVAQCCWAWQIDGNKTVPTTEYYSITLYVICVFLYAVKWIGSWNSMWHKFHFSLEPVKCGRRDELKRDKVANEKEWTECRKNELTTTEFYRSNNHNSKRRDWMCRYSLNCSFQLNCVRVTEQQIYTRCALVLLERISLVTFLNFH